jgi:hypothetical protein
MINFCIFNAYMVRWEGCYEAVAAVAYQRVLSKLEMVMM